jgi:hypothetical protein
MRPEERNLIQDLFDRIGDTSTENNDRDAERLIRDAVARNPNAPYVLVQTVLLQEEALRQAEERMRQLQEAQAAGDDGGSRSFLDSGRRVGQGGGSVPNAGIQQDERDSFRRPDDPRSAQPSYAQPAPQTAAGGGGFLSSALSTAGGVAGGMLLVDGIRSLFGGGHSGDIFGRADAQTPTTDNKSNSVDWGAQDRAQDAQQDADDDQDALQDAADDQNDSYDDGGSFDV